MEQGNSSLVHMVDYFIRCSGGSERNFFLEDFEALEVALHEEGPCILFGVSFALQDFALDRQIRKEDLMIIETGGMKGRKKEITRTELHKNLKSGFPQAEIISEYGMTELCSQCYSDEEGWYSCPPWMQVLIREDTDPMQLRRFGRGALNIADLANAHSCAFIASDDLAEIREDGKFRILGRMDQAESRGCALLLSPHS
jgi:hypothetical protein